jgi:chorismate dehydratase
MPTRVRIGAVNYLNTKPLIYNLERLAPQAQLSLDLPSRLADRLAAGALDVALIPVVEYFRGDGYTILPNIAIATRGPALSVTLFSRVPWAEVRRVALDEGSRTSAALTQIVLRERHGLTPQLQPLPTSATAEDSDADAVLLIGDRAMQSCLPGFRFAYDLGQEWHNWTGLPFVYAVWAVRPGADLGEAEDALQEAKRQGLAHVGEIAAAQAPTLGLDAGFCRRYLETVIRFDLGPPELDGLRRFYDLATGLGLAPAGGEVRFYGARRAGSVSDRSFETSQAPVAYAPGSPV